MAIRGGYAPPGVYTETVFESPTPQSNFSGRLPLLIGSGTETFAQNGITLVRGSSATVDQEIVEEDASGRVALSQNPNGTYNLGAFDGQTNVVRTLHWPIVTGDGSGSTATSAGSVSATINGSPVVVLAIKGADGLVTLSEAPNEGDDVRISYFFNRTDTFVDSEDITDQVSAETSDIFGASGSMEVGVNTRTLIITVDGTASVVELPLKPQNTTRENHLNAILGKINASSIGTLVASSYVDHKGSTNLKLVADGSILVGTGSANEVVGLFEGQRGSARNATFFTDQAPIVDGTNGGITTSEVSDVTLTVDGAPVIPVSLDPATGAVTLAQPPRVGQTVAISYFFNSFRDNFDYIPSRDVTSVNRVSLIPEGGGADSIFIEGVSWVLKDDKIYWGTFASVSEGTTQNGQVSFGRNQITATLKDERIFLAECTPVSDTSVVPPRVLPNVFKLPHQPTDGTGMGTPTSNTTKVIVRIGSNISDALENDPVDVVRVNPTDSTVTLSETVPFGQKVFATFYYNNIQDEFEIAGGGYEVTVASIGGSNVGTYSLSRSGLPLYGVSFEGKGSDLSLISLNFPSGSETLSDATLGSGRAVEETVSVQIGSFDPTPSIFVAPNPAPFAFISGNSDEFKITVDSNGENTINLSSPSTQGSSLFTYHVGNPLPYVPETDNADLGNDAISGDIFLKIDNVDVSVNLLAVANATATDFALAINTAFNAVGAKYYSMVTMGAVDLSSGRHNVLRVNYVGDANGATQHDLTLTAQAYDNASDVATEIETQIDDLANFNGAVDLNVSVEDGFLVFTLDGLEAGDTSGYIEFLSTGDDTDFALISGIDTDTGVGGAQTKFGILPVASFVSTDLSADSNALKDRLVLRNRTRVGANYTAPVQLGLEVTGGSLLAESGLELEEVLSARSSVVESPSLLLRVGRNAQSAVNGSPEITFYDGTNALFAQNNTLNLDISGETVSVTFSASGAGTDTDLFKDGLTDAGTAWAQINTALGALGSVVIEGDRLRIVATGNTEDDYIRVLEGTANDLLGLFGDQTEVATLVSATALSSAVMQHSSASVGAVMTSVLPVGGFGSQGISYIEKNAIGESFVAFESLTTGISSILSFGSATAFLRHTTRLGVVSGDGEVGENAYQGFFVTSTNASGSGSANTSVLNDGTGADGVIGQTYVDAVTGFSFTLLPRVGAQPYPTGVNSTLSFKVSRAIRANANIPVSAITGVSLIVSNTVGTEVGDTAIIETYLKDGKEPSIGTPYFMDVTRRKTVYNTGIFNRLSDVVSAYGPVAVDNPLSLGAYIAFLNGAQTIALKQIPLEEGQAEPSVAQMSQALIEVEGEIAVGVSPSVIVPLIPASSELLSDISVHCDVQSSLRFRSERTAILGVPAGTSPEQASTLARNVRNSRVRLIYPDIVSLTLTDTNGVSQNVIVDGRYLAVALAFVTTSANIDVATPWTNRTVVGFNGLLRNLDAVDANKAASSGVTILQQQGAVLNVRQGLTTDGTSILSKTPTVVQIADEVHLRARNLLNGYIGEKYLPSVVGQVEGRVNMMFKDLVKEQIIDSYTGLSVDRDPEDPTGLLVEVYYKPIFPLLYIQFTFNVRSSI
jgi:hypothetical protein